MCLIGTTKILLGGIFVVVDIRRHIVVMRKIEEKNKTKTENARQKTRLNSFYD
jgi:hypothetical protein